MSHREGAQRASARRFRVRRAVIVRRLQRRRDAGTRGPKPHGGGPPPGLGPDDQQRLAELIREQPDATGEQLNQRGGFTCRPEVPEERRCFRLEVRPIEPKRRVFGDETGVTTAMIPADAGAERGVRAVGAAPATWEAVTVIAA